MTIYYCVITQMPFQRTDDGLTDIYRKAVTGSDIHRVLCGYMQKRGIKYVGLSTPKVRPTSFIVQKMPRFYNRFPEEYVREVDTLLGQGGNVPEALVINHETNKARTVKVSSLKMYNSVLLSLFVQSVQQVNQTSRILYRMVGLVPEHGLGKFISSETTQCCFQNLVAKLNSTNRGEFEIKFFVRDHIRHNSPFDHSSVSKWFNCDVATC